MTTPNMSGLTPWKAVAAAYMRMRALASTHTLHESESRRRCTMAGRTLNVEPTQDYPGLLKTPGKEESWTWPIFLWDQKGSQKEEPEKAPGLKRPWHRYSYLFTIIFLNPFASVYHPSATFICYPYLRLTFSLPTDPTQGLLGRLDGALLLDYDATDAIGVVLPHRMVPSILIGGINDVRQLDGTPLIDYNTVEGMDAPIIIAQRQFSGC